MEEKSYFNIRVTAFWLFTVSFIIMTPIILFYSLGYKFNIKSKHFIRTGTISIKTKPDNAQVFLDNKNLEKSTPCILAELFPGTYTIELDKTNFYPYKTLVEVKPSVATELNIVLVPQIKNLQKIDFSFNVYKFFVVGHIFGGKIFIFTDQGIYLADKDFKNTQRISSYSLGAGEAASLQGVIEVDDKLVFWNFNNVWMIDISQIRDNKEVALLALYKAKRSIRKVFLGIRDKYIILQDGLDVNALDMDNKVIFPIIKLKNVNSEIFYDSASETFYVREKIPWSDSFSIFRLDMFPSLFEKLKNEKIS